MFDEITLPMDLIASGTPASLKSLPICFAGFKLQACLIFLKII
jgi:hypothetical protein